MKKVLLMAAALLLAPMAAHAEKYVEGVNYTVINDLPGSAKPEITEYFSFFCGHCYNFAKSALPIVKETLPEGVKFNQSHVEFIGREMGVEMSRAFAIAHLLKVEDKIEPALFSAIHDKKQRFTNQNDIRLLFIANGISGEDFDKAANSFMVNSQLAKMRKDAQTAQISGVPTLVVNGKYRVENKGIKSYEELLDIAYYLSTKDKQ